MPLTSTGDINNNVYKLRTELKSIKYMGKFDLEGVLSGNISAFLPFIHHTFLEFSRLVAKHLASQNIELYGKSEHRFLENIYKALRAVFNYTPLLSLTQLRSDGFAERKVMLVYDMIRLCKDKHNELYREKMKHKRTRSTIGYSKNTEASRNRAKAVDSNAHRPNTSVVRHRDPASSNNASNRQRSRSLSHSKTLSNSLPDAATEQSQNSDWFQTKSSNIDASQSKKREEKRSTPVSVSQENIPFDFKIMMDAMKRNLNRVENSVTSSIERLESRVNTAEGKIKFMEGQQQRNNESMRELRQKVVQLQTRSFSTSSSSPQQQKAWNSREPDIKTKSSEEDNELDTNTEQHPFKSMPKPENLDDSSHSESYLNQSISNQDESEYSQPTQMRDETIEYSVPNASEEKTDTLSIPDFSTSYKDNETNKIVDGISRKFRETQELLNKSCYTNTQYM
eukprot:gb/GECH01000144.1/.p1 GENE.gb/GECH01000144.1/~~gb/GECH01000144.1/.p1  ORF type:complete len:452 (+),score=100.42 gb/GECH01000144.1/:1-1356(+)